MSRIRVSSAGACPKRVQYEAWGIVGLPPWEGTERAFEEGNIHEASILKWAAEHLPGAPYVIHDEQKEAAPDPKHGMGSYDKGRCRAVADNAFPRMEGKLFGRKDAYGLGSHRLCNQGIWSEHRHRMACVYAGLSSSEEAGGFARTYVAREQHAGLAGLQKIGDFQCCDALVSTEWPAGEGLRMRQQWIVCVDMQRLGRALRC